tara:strand:- start:4634 stop:4822 length:189 start_codon:yes stop_codon:yes gene_type:complete
MTLTTYYCKLQAEYQKKINLLQEDLNNSLQIDDEELSENYIDKFEYKLKDLNKFIKRNKINK